MPVRLLARLCALGIAIPLVFGLTQPHEDHALPGWRGEVTGDAVAYGKVCHAAGTAASKHRLHRCFGRKYTIPDHIAAQNSFLFTTQAAYQL